MQQTRLLVHIARIDNLAWERERLIIWLFYYSRRSEIFREHRNCRDFSTTEYVRYWLAADDCCRLTGGDFVPLRDVNSFDTLSHVAYSSVAASLRLEPTSNEPRRGVRCIGVLAAIPVGWLKYFVCCWNIESTLVSVVLIRTCFSDRVASTRVSMSVSVPRWGHPLQPGRRKQDAGCRTRLVIHHTVPSVSNILLCGTF